MKKSIRVCLLFAAVIAVSSTPLLAAPSGTNPHPTVDATSTLVSAALALLGF